MPRCALDPAPVARRENRYGSRVIAPRPVWTQVARRSLCLGLAASVAGLCPRPASAAVMVAAGPAEEAPLDAAKRLYDEGLAHFQTHDYEGAVQKWTLAYSKLPEDAPGQRNAMVYNIATAQEKAYELDKDLQHLRQAQLLLESYVKTYKAMYKKTPETKVEVDKANERIQALRDRIAAAESGAPPTAPTPVQTGNVTGGQLGTHDGIQWSTGHTPPVDQEKLAHNRRLSGESSKADTLIIAGWATGSVGLFLLLVGAGAVAGGESTGRRGATYGGVGALVLGAGGVAAGGALLGIGFKKRKAVKEGRIAAGPVLYPGFAGAGISGRF